ncbi:4Fe-4S binding protein [Chloroflexota bacterium]
MADEPQAISVGELRKSGIVRLKEQDMFSVWVKTACCNLNSEQLRKLADITEKYGRGYLLFTTRQIPIIPFVKLNDLEAVREELSEVYMWLDRCGPTVRNVNVCYNDSTCPQAVTNAIPLAEKLDNFFYQPLTHKLKLGVAGCKQDCIISRVLADIGFIGVERDGRRGYDVYVGGRLGLNPAVGVKMADCLGEEECLRLVQNAFDLLKEEGKAEERCADLINRLGVARVKREVNRNLQEGLVPEPIACPTHSQEKVTDKIILRIRATCGEVTAQQLRKIADVAQGYGQGFVHFSVRGAPEIPGVAAGQLESIKKELSGVDLSVLDKGIDNLQSCFGNYCTEGNMDPQSLLRRVEELTKEMDLNNQNIKVSASGCPNSCGIAHLNDIGFMGVVGPVIDEIKCNGCDLCVPICKRKAITMKDGLAVIDKEQCVNCGQCIAVCPFDAIVEARRGFAVLVGGKEGEDTRLGRLIGEFLSEEEALEVAEGVLKLLKERGTNAADIIDEVGGLEKFKEMVPGTGQL